LEEWQQLKNALIYVLSIIFTQIAKSLKLKKLTGLLLNSLEKEEIKTE
jgi:hypothetical protein